MPSKSNAHPDKIKVMFVCLGNICRSPLAHGLFRDLVTEDKEIRNPNLFEEIRHEH